MRWIITFLLALSVILLWQIKPNVKEVRDEVVRSERVVYNKAWRAQLEREMTIREMERYAAGLSDEELWEEIDELCHRWIEVNEARKLKKRPRLSVILAREVGKRHGEAGLMEMGAFVEEMESDYLGTNLRYAVFGGWSAVEPDEAITNVLSNVQGSDDSDPEFPIIFMNMNFVDTFSFSEIWAGNRVMRAAFAGLAEVNPDRAMELLIEGTNQFIFDPNQFFESVEPHLNQETKENLMSQLNENSEEHYSFFYEGIWSDPIELAAEGVGRFRGGLLAETLARAKPEAAFELLQNGSVDVEMGSTLMTFLSAYDSRWITSFQDEPITVKRELMESLLNDDTSFSFGPLDGREGGLFPDWIAHYEQLEEFVEGADFEKQEGDGYLALVREHLEVVRD